MLVNILLLPLYNSRPKSYTSRYYLIDVEVLRMLRYCKISGTVINRRALRNLSPTQTRVILSLGNHTTYQSKSCQGKWTQMKEGWWNSQQRSTALAWTTTCLRQQWTRQKNINVVSRKSKICTLMKKYTMKKMLNARSICCVVFSSQGIHVSTASLVSGIIKIAYHGSWTTWMHL